MTKDKATETIDKLFLELSQVTTASTRKERNLSTRWSLFEMLVSSWLCEIQEGNANLKPLNSTQTLQMVQEQLVRLSREYPA